MLISIDAKLQLNNINCNK